MPAHDLLSVCLTAFVAVFVILAGLALLMRLMLALFPGGGEEADDAPVLAALAASLARMYPGRRITRIEEVK